jgi:hypothetical protein
MALALAFFWAGVRDLNSVAPTDPEKEGAGMKSATPRIAIEVIIAAFSRAPGALLLLVISIAFFPLPDGYNPSGSPQLRGGS